MKSTKESEANFGFSPVAAEAKQGLVNEVFARVARRYDMMNDLMSGGLHRLWKDDLISWLAPPKGASPFALLDVAGGTGDIASRFLGASGSGARAVICDISAEMLAVGRERAAGEERLAFVLGNAEFLPFPGRSFDALTPHVPTGWSTITDPPLIPISSNEIGFAGPLRSASDSCFLTRRLS